MDRRYGKERRLLGPVVEATRRFWEPWGVALVLALLGMLLLRNWLGPQLPSSPRQESLPEVHFILSQLDDLEHGRLPSPWNPREFNGYPWLLFMSSVYYLAIALLSYLSQVPVAQLLKVVQFVNFFGSALAMYLYMRAVLRERLPALVSAVLYLWLPAHAFLGVETLIHSTIWLIVPLLLYADERMLAAPARQRWRWAAGIGVLLALLAAVSSEYLIIAAPVLIVYTLAREGMTIRGGDSSLPQSAGRLLLMGSVAAGLAAFALVPGTLSLATVSIHVKYGTAATAPTDVLREFVVTPALMVRAIASRTRLPIPYGHLPGMWNVFWSEAWYPGLVASFLAAGGLLALRRRPLARLVLFLLALTYLQSLGCWLPGNPFAFVPVLKNLLAFRSLLLVGVFLAALAGFGVSSLLSLLRPSLRLWSGVLLAGLVLLDFAPPASSAFIGVPSYFSPQEQAAQQWLAERRGDDGYRLWEPIASDRESYRLWLDLNRIGMPRFWGYYDNGSTLWSWRLYHGVDRATGLHLSSVRYVLLHPDLATDAGVRKLLTDAHYRLLDWHIDGLSLYEAESALPYARAYSVAALQIGASDADALALLPALAERELALVSGGSSFLDDYDAAATAPYRYLFIEGASTRQQGSQGAWVAERLGQVQAISQAADLPPAEAADRGQVQWQRPSPTQVDVEVDLAAPAVVSIAESWHPGWQVLVDGSPAPLLRVNYAFQGVWVGAGSHRIVFRYRQPLLFHLATAVSIATALALVIVFAGRRLRR